MNRNYYWLLLNKGGTGAGEDPGPQPLYCYLSDFILYNNTSTFNANFRFVTQVSCNTAPAGSFDTEQNISPTNNVTFSNRQRGIALPFSWYAISKTHNVTVEYSTNSGASYSPIQTFTAIANGTPYSTTLSLGTWAHAFIRFRVTSIT